MAKSDKRFVHLHVHSDYSLLDGAAKIQKMVQFAAADNQPGLAITDHGGMPGIIQLFKYAAIAGITPIPGIEVYHVPDVNKMRDKVRTEGKSRFHMILLATTSVGYQNLLRLSSEAHLDHFYSKPNVDDAMLAKYSEGVVATSGCLGSRVNQALLAGKYEEAKKFASIHQDIYGRENYFIEVQNHGIEDQLKILPLQVKLSKELGAPLLAANDSHYVDKSEAQMHDALLCLQTAARLTDEDRFRFDGSNNYMRSAAEMYELFPHRDFPNACSNTLLIEEMARGIDVGLPKKVDGKVVQQYLIPEFALPDKKLTAQKHLANLVNTGARKLYAEDGKLPQIVVDRIAMELKVIHEMGFDNYFLIVGDIVQWAKAQGIRVGPGRGSAAGSIVAFCTGITGVDPIHYKLYFERFLNPGRKSMPDIDIDFERDRRGEVSQYVALKYPGRTAYIATYGVLRPKTAMLGASRVLGNAVSVGQRLSGMWMGTVNQIDAPLREILGDAPTDEKFTDHWRMGAPLRDTYKKDGVSREAIDLAIQLEGIHNQKGIHPAGLLITPGPLTDYVPLHRAKEGDVPVCSFDKDDSEAIGGLKMDLLGLVNLSMIGRTIELVKLDVGTNIDIDNIPLDDNKVYKLLGEGDTDGVFQLESHGMRDLLRRVKPESIEDISAVIALFRPGPMGSNLHLQYADAKNGKIKIQVPDKHMHALFVDTFSCMVYQEQLIALAQHYAGYDASEADSFRKAVGKKDADLIAHQEASFKAGVLKNGYAQSVADKMWEMIPPFAAYAFNKSHSVAYAFISYQTAWLKVNYPAQYAAACIDFLSSDKVFVQVESARRSGVRVSPPNINSSRARATTSAGHVWLGLGGISNCGPAALTGILTAQEDGEFNTLGDFMVRTSGVNRKTIHSLVSAGCFDSLHGSRKIMHDNIEVMLGRARRAKTVGQAEDVMGGLFGDVMAESGIKDSMDFDLDGEDYTTSQRIANEIMALGFPASEHPFHFVREYLEYAPTGDSFIPRAATPVGEDHLVEGSQVVIFGTASSVVFTDAKGTVKPKTTFFIETDKGGRAKCVAFGFEFAALNAGDLVIADGMLRKYQVAGADQEEFRVTGGKFIDLDRIVAETKLLSASGKKAPKEYAPEGRKMTGRPDENQRTSRRRNSTGSEAASARSASTTGETVTFTLDEQYQVQELVTVLGKLNAGDTKVFIGFGGQVGSSDDGYDLSKKKASKIAEKLGVGVAF